VLGEPDRELEDLIGEIEEIHQAARKPIRHGALGHEIYLEPEALVVKSANRAHLSFVAHGMGIVSHEAPWLSDKCSVPYPAYHADRPLEAGMVVSIETTRLRQARRHGGGDTRRVESLRRSWPRLEPRPDLTAGKRR
jgi:Xaa-Pro dipeptidase